MYPIEKYKFTTYVQKNEDETDTIVVVALSTYAGKTVKGVAKCASTDKFDLEVGKKLAAARCDWKVCRKRLMNAHKRRQQLVNHMAEVQLQFNKVNDTYSRAMEEALRSMEHLKVLETQLA